MSTASAPSRDFVVYAALAGNLLVAATKAGAAFWTGSASMFSEAVHSFVDTGNEVLLLYGIHRSKADADPLHPIGYGRELYFWSFIVAVMIFALGAAVSVYQGITHVLAPQAIEDPVVSYVVLGLAFLFEGGSWIVALRQFNAAKGDLGFIQAYRRSKDPSSFVVLFEDSAALVGIALAAAGTFASDRLGVLEADGVASILIGLLLAGTATLLARQSKSLLIGERADRGLTESIRRVTGEVHAVDCVNGLFTVQLAPDQVVVALSLEFADALRTPEIEAAVIEIEKRLRVAHPEVTSVFIKPQTNRTYRDKAQQMPEDTEPVP